MLCSPRVIACSYERGGSKRWERFDFSKVTMAAPVGHQETVRGTLHRLPQRGYAVQSIVLWRLKKDSPDNRRSFESIRNNLFTSHFSSAVRVRILAPDSADAGRVVAPFPLQ